MKMILFPLFGYLLFLKSEVHSARPGVRLPPLQSSHSMVSEQACNWQAGTRIRHMRPAAVWQTQKLDLLF